MELILELLDMDKAKKKPVEKKPAPKKEKEPVVKKEEPPVEKPTKKKEEPVAKEPVEEKPVKKEKTVVKKDEKPAHKKEWSKEVKTKKHSPKDLFADGSAAEIAEWLEETHDDIDGAKAAITFYINRAGTKLSSERRRTLEKAKRLLGDGKEE
jgi:hypothetical protein